MKPIYCAIITRIHEISGLERIVSGGQSGVDRAALDAALEAGFPTGGWCPAGRRAEDGPIHDRYPLRELDGGYLARTERNVIDSDATLIVHFGPLSGGTLRTFEFCRKHRKPCLLVDGAELTPEQAASKVLEFIRQHPVATLNVAGPRASGNARAYPFAHALLEKVLLQDGVTNSH